MVTTFEPKFRPGAKRRVDVARQAPRFPENYYSAKRTETSGVIGRPADKGPALNPVAAASAAPTGTVLDEWLPMLESADQAYQLRQYGAAAFSYTVLVERIADVPADVWDSLTPAQQQEALQYSLRGQFGQADSNHAFGDYEIAEGNYAGILFDLPSLLSQDQLAYIFLHWSMLYLDWGNALFRDDAPADALTQYAKVIGPDGTVPASVNGGLYGFPLMQTSVNAATKIIQNIDALIGQQQTANTLGVNPILAATIVEVHLHLGQITNGLDFWGHRENSIPIWTFDYLQSAAINFTQFAINAERDFINFQQRSDEGSATRQQLTQLAAQAGAEVDAAAAQVAAAAAEAQAYNTGETLAAQRADTAQLNANEYAASSALSIQFDALRAQIGGGDGGSTQILNDIADTFVGGGHPVVGDNLDPSSDLYGVYSRNNVSAGAQLAGAKLSRQYEVDSMNRSAQDMRLAVQQASEEAAAAQARLAAARAGTAVATLHAEAAQQNLAAFDTQTFTPDVWQRMADTMWRLYRRYLDMALRTALLMQKAYNFETDQALRFIKKDYSTDEVKGLLGADALMADIQSFTYDLITSTIGKSQPVRQSISLAQRYAYLFENQFRRTGVMEFETRIDDFDNVYPGTYAGRLESVQVELVGLVPPTGVSGMLTNSGISGYRTPATVQTEGTSGLKYRIQPKETLVLSDYAARVDGGLIPPDQRLKGIFQGSGLVSSWRLEVPREINDIDYGALLDVRLTFFYRARFDPDLHDTVLAELASRPGIQSRHRGVPLRWVYPDAFFQFQDSGVLAISQRIQDFASNETLPVITDVGIVVATDGSLSPQGLSVRLSTPARNAVAATADANGLIDSGAAGSPWTALLGGTAIGDYVLSLDAADNPGLVKNGKLDLSPIVNVALVLGYSFTAKTSSGQKPSGPPVQIAPPILPPIRSRSSSKSR